MKLGEEFKTVGFFYVMTGIYWVSIGFMAGYWTLYLSTIGLSFSAIAILLAMYPIVSILFEIPTGAIADIFGRKVSVFLSYLLTGIAFTGVLLSGTNFPLLLLFYILAGISFTLETGALEAWFVDTVKHKKQTKHLNRLFGRWGSISAVGFAIGPLLGGILVTFGVEKAFWATALTMIALAVIVLIFGTEEYFKPRKTRIIDGFKQTFKTGKDGFKQIFTHPVLLIMTLTLTIFTFANMGIAFNAYQVYVVEIGLNPFFIGLALSLAGFISIFALNFSHKIKDFVGGNRNTLLLFSFLGGLVLLGVGVIRILPLLFLCMVLRAVFFEFASGPSPAYRELFNKYVPSRIRATTLSVNSFNTQIGDLLGIVVFGIFSVMFGLQKIIIFAAILMMVSSFLYLKIKK